MAAKRYFAMSGLLLAVAMCGAARADNTLEQWRGRAGEIRMLAENDVPRAYAEAERLQADLPAAAMPADRARLLNLLARIEVYLAQTEQAAGHIQQAMDISKQHDDRVGQAEADLNTALNAINQARIDDAIAAAIHSLAMLDGVARPELLGEALLRMAMMARRTDQLDESVTLSMQAMEIARQSNNPLALAYAHQGLAISYEQSDRFAEAREHYQRMLEQARTAGSRLLEAYALQGLGNIFGGLGDLRSSERMIREAIDIYRAVGTPFNVNFGLFALADSFRKQGRYAEALPLLDEIIDRDRRYPNKIGLLLALNARSADRMALGDIAEARRDVEQAYALAKEIGSPLYLTDSAKQLAAIAAATGHHKQAYQLLAEASDMAVKTANESAAARMLQFTRRYQTETKQREIDKLNRRNQQQAEELLRRALERRWLWTVLGGSFVMLAGAGFFLLRLRRSHRGLQALNKQVLQAKNKLQARLDTIPDPMFELGLDGRYYDYHSPRTDLPAVPADAVLGKTVSEVMPADAAAVCLDALREAHDNGRSLGKQLFLSLPHGDFWFELSVAAKPIEAGEKPRFIVLSRDITERKQAEQKISFMSYALDYLNDAVFLMESGFRFIYVNEQACRSLGYSREELLGMAVPDIDPQVDQPQAEAIYAEMLKQGVIRFETVHRRRDGLVFPVEVSGSAFTYDGEPKIVAVARDLTERKRIERQIRSLNANLEQQVLERTEELRQQTRYLRTLIDTLPLLIWLKDTESRFVLVNQATADSCHLAIDDMVGKSDRDLWPNERAEAYIAEDKAVMATRRRKIVEETFADKRGPIWIEVDKVPVLDEDGSVLGTVGVARNISERKAMETAREAALAEAERLARLRSEFMARMSHELRTPLNGILGYAQVLLGETGLNERQGAMLNVIQQSGEHLLNLINDILDFAKIEAGKQTLSMSEVALPRFLRNLAGIVSVKAEQKHLAFECDIAPDVPEAIRADETRLRQVLLNLLSNAVKFSERGCISLRVTVLAPNAGGLGRSPSGLEAHDPHCPAGCRLRFEIQDNGIGIETPQLESIFQPFEQVENSRQRNGGTGLGLPISRELVRLMGSDIRVGSRPGEGSTFWFDLDVAVVSGNGEDMAGGGIRALPKAEPASGEWLDAPPLEEMKILHRLAREGSMRDIIRHAAHLERLDECYRPFAEQLRGLARGYQSKAVLDLVERYINKNHDAS